MSNDPANPYHPTAIALAALRAKRSELAAILAEIDKEIARLEHGEPSRETASVAPLPALPEFAFQCMTIAEAATSHLRSHGKPLVSREIAAALVSAGFPIKHSNPAHAVQNQLGKRAKREGDVLTVGYGRWGLKEWYTGAELEEIDRTKSGTPGRDAALHKEKVREALDVARSRGTRVGRLRFHELYTEDEFVKFRRLRASGVGVRAALAQIDMPYTTYHKYKREVDGPGGDPAGKVTPPKLSSPVPSNKENGA